MSPPEAVRGRHLCGHFFDGASQARTADLPGAIAPGGAAQAPLGLVERSAICPVRSDLVQFGSTGDCTASVVASGSRHRQALTVRDLESQVLDRGVAVFSLLSRDKDTPWLRARRRGARKRQPGGAPDALRILRHVCDPLFSRVRGRATRASADACSSGREVAANEREGRSRPPHGRGARRAPRLRVRGAGRPRVRRRERQSRTRSPWRSASTAIDESACELDLVVERSAQRAVGGGQRRAGSERASCVRGGVVEHAVEEVRRHDAAPPAASSASSAASTTTRSRVAERRLDDGEAVLRRRIGGCAYERRAPRRSVAGERGCEERDGESPSRRNAAAALPAVRGSSSAATTRRRLPALPRRAGITQSSAAARTVGSASSRRPMSMFASAVTPARAERGRGRAPVGRVGGVGEVVASAGDLRGGLRVSRRGELDECPHAHLGIRVLATPGEAPRRKPATRAGQQIEAEAHVTRILGPEQRLHRGVVLGDVDVARDERPASASRRRARVCTTGTSPNRDYRPDQAQHEHRTRSPRRFRGRARSGPAGRRRWRRSRRGRRCLRRPPARRAGPGPEPPGTRR